jgi:asparagine synthase (glutamine-hydrolysing)
MADSVRAAQGTSLAAVRTFSMVFDKAKTADEREFIGEVETQRGEKGVHILEDDCPFLSIINYDDAFDQPSSMRLCEGIYRQFASAMGECGARVILSGEGGDYVFWGETLAIDQLGDLFSEGRYTELYRSLRQWLQKYPTASVSSILWRSAFRPTLPRFMRRSLFRVSTPPWIDKEFARRVNLRDRMLGSSDSAGLKFSLPSGATLWRDLQNLSNRFSSGNMRAFPTKSWVISSYPYLDRKVVEFALALPLDQNVRINESRSLLRRALTGILPDKIRHRRLKTSPDEAFLRAYIRQSELLEDWKRNLQLTRRGFVEAKGFSAELAKAKQGFVPHTAHFMKALTLELWLQSLSRWNCS